MTGNLQLIRQELRFEFVAFFSLKGQVQNKKDAKETFDWKVALSVNKWYSLSFTAKLFECTFLLM